MTVGVSIRGLAWGMFGLVLAFACDRAESPVAPGTNQPKPTVASSPGPVSIAAPSDGEVVAPHVPEVLDLVHHATTVIESSSHRDATSRVEFSVDDLAISQWRPNPRDAEPWVELAFAYEVHVHEVVVELDVGADAGLAFDVRSPTPGLASRERERSSSGRLHPCRFMNCGSCFCRAKSRRRIRASGQERWHWVNCACAVP